MGYLCSTGLAMGFQLICTVISVLFLISSLLVVWILFDHQGALAANVLLFAMALFMIRQYRLIRRAFVAGLPATSGHVQGDPIRGLLTTPRREFGGAHVAFNNDYD